MEDCYNILKEYGFRFVRRGPIYVKGKGELLTYFMKGKDKPVTKTAGVSLPHQILQSWEDTRRHFVSGFSKKAWPWFYGKENRERKGNYWKEKGESWRRPKSHKYAQQRNMQRFTIYASLKHLHFKKQIQKHLQLNNPIKIALKHVCCVSHIFWIFLNKNMKVWALYGHSKAIAKKMFF